MSDYESEVWRLKRRARNHNYKLYDATFTMAMCSFALLLAYTMGKESGRKLEREDAKNKIEFMAECNKELDNLFLCQNLLQDKRR